MAISLGAPARLLLSQVWGWVIAAPGWSEPGFWLERISMVQIRALPARFLVNISYFLVKI
jgi:hypothetical protein